MIRRRLGLHVALFIAASGLALRAWTAEDEPNKKAVAAELWSGKVTDLSRIEYRTDKKLVSLEPKEDEGGRYYIGSVQPIAAEKPKAAAADAGVPAGHPPPPEESNEPKRFISLSKGKELAESLATLKASRVLGKIAPERIADFGFDKTDGGTLTVVVGGKEHTLAFGEKTPGGSDRYVRDTVTGEAYVITGLIANDLTSADNRLIEREFHDFGDDRVAKVTLETSAGKREVVRHAVEKDFWARPESPDTKDETVSNWMTKVDRLKVTTYVEPLEPPAKPEDEVVKLTYFNDHGRQLGYLELVRRPSKDAKDKPEYVARSERTRWHATVLRSTAEQIEQDLASVMAP
jgi:uncharacterized protein DUF4340